MAKVSAFISNYGFDFMVLKFLNGLSQMFFLKIKVYNFAKFFFMNANLSKGANNVFEPW
jgi:hypothetical protein